MSSLQESCRTLVTRDNFELVLPPAYSSALTPLERLRLVIKAAWVPDLISKDRIQLIERLDETLPWAMEWGIANQQSCSM